MELKRRPSYLASLTRLWKSICYWFLLWTLEKWLREICNQGNNSKLEIFEALMALLNYPLWNQDRAVRVAEYNHEFHTIPNSWEHYSPKLWCARRLLTLCNPDSWEQGCIREQRLNDYVPRVWTGEKQFDFLLFSFTHHCLCQ